jgi:hypothetical protein
MAASVAAAANPPCWMVAGAERKDPGDGCSHVTDRVSVVIPREYSGAFGGVKRKLAPKRRTPPRAGTAFVWRCSMTTTSYGSNALDPDRTDCVQAGRVGSGR